MISRGRSARPWKSSLSMTALLVNACCGCPGAPLESPGAAADALASGGVAGEQAYDWRNVVILGGGFVTGVVWSQAEKDLVYARTDIGGAYRMSPADKSWVPLLDSLHADQNHYMGVESLALDPRDPNRVHLAVGTYTQSWAAMGAMLRSTDRGETWELTEVPIKMGGNEDGRGMGERLVVDPNQGDIILFGSRKAGLWRSDDAGKTWREGTFPHREEALGVGIGFVLFDAASGERGSPTPVVYAGWAGKEASLYVSKNAGADWEPVPNQPRGLIPNHAGLDSEGVLYLSYGNTPGPSNMTAGAVWKYEPKAGRWTDITPLEPRPGDEFGYGACSVLPSAAGQVLVTTLDRWGPGDDAFRTVDGGKTWKSVLKEGQHDEASAAYLYWGRTGPDGLSKSGWMADVDLDPFNPARATYVTGQGIWLTENLTAADQKEPPRWVFENRGLEETAVNDLTAPASGPPLLSALGDLGGFRHDDLTRSPASGMFQNPIFGNGHGIDHAELKPEVVVRVGTRSHGSEAVRGAISRDGGATWAPFESEPPGDGGGSIAINADATAILWAPKNGSVVLSVDGGKTWSRAQGLPDAPQLPDWAPVNFRLATDRKNPSGVVVYDATNGSAYFSTDAGATFTESKSGLPAKPEYALVPTWVEAVPGHEGHAWAATGEELYRTVDGGRTWQPVDSLGASAGIGFGKAKEGASYPAVYFIGKVEETYGIYRSDDEGKRWTRINDARQQFGGANRIIGDPNTHGRAYIGTHGRGILVGDPR